MYTPEDLDSKNFQWLIRCYQQKGGFIQQGIPGFRVPGSEFWDGTFQGYRLLLVVLLPG